MTPADFVSAHVRAHGQTFNQQGNNKLIFHPPAAIPNINDLQPIWPTFFYVMTEDGDG